jgi:hypothetical protein
MKGARGTFDGRFHLSRPDAGAPVTAFTGKRELQTYLKWRLDTFINPLYTFLDNQGTPSIMTMSADRANKAEFP